MVLSANDRDVSERPSTVIPHYNDPRGGAHDARPARRTHGGLEMPDLPPPPRPQPADEGWRRAVLETLRLVTRWTMPAAEWERVDDLLGAMERTHAAGDRHAFDQAHDSLVGIGLLQARRFGAEEEPGARPVPPPTRERRNTLVHRLEFPKEAAGEAAAKNAQDDLSRMTGPARWWAERTFLRLPVLDRAAVARASTHDENDVPGHESFVDGTMLVIRRGGNPNAVEVVVVAPGARGGDVVALASGPEPETIVFLLPLWPDRRDLVSAIEVPTTAIQLNDAITVPFPGEWLDGTDVDAVLRSVRMADRAGRNAWRAIALSREAGDPVRTAIIEGLR